MFYKVALTVGNTTYNSYDDWGLIAVSKPVISAPAIDKDGKPTANQSSWNFLLVDLADFPAAPTAQSSTYNTYLTICNAVNGKQCTIRLYEDNVLYDTATGTVSVSDFATQNYRSTLTLSVEAIGSGTTTEADFANLHSLSFTIGETTYNTYTDWHLSPQSIPIVNPPKPRTSYVVTPGANGAIDLTEVFGQVFYDNAEGSWTFKVLDEYYSSASTIFSGIVSALNGKAGSVGTHTGRFTVSGLSISSGVATVNIDYVIEPW